MFDSFMLKVTCPKCKKTATTEFQTKQFNNIMNVWHEGELFTPIGIEKGAILGVYGSCNYCNTSLICDVQIIKCKVKKAINVRVR